MNELKEDIKILTNQPSKIGFWYNVGKIKMEEQVLQSGITS
jgi:hypothetical protein